MSRTTAHRIMAITVYVPGIELPIHGVAPSTADHEAVSYGNPSTQFSYFYVISLRLVQRQGCLLDSLGWDFAGSSPARSAALACVTYQTC